MLVGGNTGHGVYRRSEDIKYYIDTRLVKDLKSYTFNKNEKIIGGNVTLTDTMDIFKEAATLSGFEYCGELLKHFNMIANVPVRNVNVNKI